ncbi:MULTISPECIES: site-specific DNA-methyltransferase [Aeromonas]|uniref:site-specific DNA-methyltransferase n=1 Tax=Aeromonas TaxID=642 RepID=UPI0016021ABA|nr:MULTISPECIES: site-specific DNA-methyltransferase [Aeromonas]MEA9426367.1 site-specific DNA-methyltransferase [Aeromonas caviae]MEA9431459.1 site-specific DNA-methyltransferase [Aeromonas caviae]GJA16926.1 hypothetical protein KAM335_41220 [Aeromonas caviae]GJA25776.1 hypothetical protein KAM337_43040 [Aeromonas caviae]GJB22197.1 hypothetical protein KAM364_41090 [Aeromonas caviae]
MAYRVKNLKDITKPTITPDQTRKIIHGCNTDVLPLLASKFDGKIKCIYIDPPYNNGDNYEHYEDNISHEKWGEMMFKCLSLLSPLLDSNGSIWISIDDNEMHYLKVIADKVFGRKNFITTIAWQHRTTRENRKTFSKNHEYILVYAKNAREFSKYRNLLAPSQELLSRYKNPDNDPRGPWQSISLNVQAGHAVQSQFYEIESPSGRKYSPPKGRCWAFNEARMIDEIRKNNIYFGLNGDATPRKKKFLSESKIGLTPESLWLAIDVGTTKDAKQHILSLFPEQSVFETPKPESLLKRIIEIATKPGDIVLDAFLGSGTTCSVAHKMGRSYIGIESGDHIFDYAVQRMKKVVGGEEGGISKEVNWLGGGNFDFYI